MTAGRLCWWPLSFRDHKANGASRSPPRAQRKSAREGISERDLTGGGKRGEAETARRIDARVELRPRPSGPGPQQPMRKRERRHEPWRTLTFKSNLMRLLFSVSGHRSAMNASATHGAPVLTSLLRALLTNAFGNSCSSPHLSVTCMRFTPLRKVNWSRPFCPLSKSLNLPDCGIFFNRSAVESQ